MVSYPYHIFPGHAYPKRLTSTQCLTFHQQLTTNERCRTRESNLRTPERKPRYATDCAVRAGSTFMNKVAVTPG